MVWPYNSPISVGRRRGGTSLVQMISTCRDGGFGLRGRGVGTLCASLMPPVHLELDPLYLTLYHRVGRVLSFFFSRRNWDCPQSLTRRASVPPPPGSGGRGLGESQFRRGDIHCTVLFIYTYFVPFTHQHRRPASSDRHAASGGPLRRLQLRPVGGTGGATVAK